MMISTKTIEAVYPLAQLLTDKGLCVQAQGSTPVHGLIEAGHYPQPPINAQYYPPIEERIVLGSKHTDAFGVCQHDLTMEEMVGVISQTVQENLKLARNTINPIVKRVTENTQAYVDSAENRFQERISIVPFQLPSLWDSPALQSMIQRYEETPFRSVPLRVVFEETPSVELLKQWFRTGSQQFDTEVDSFLQSLGDETLIGLWQRVFAPVMSEDRAKTLEEIIPVKDPLLERHRLNQMVLIHLLARTLSEDPPYGTNVTMSEYKSQLVDMRSQSGRAINAIVQRRQSAIARKQLIGTWPVQPNNTKARIEVVVNGDVYFKWLEDGGDADALLGAFISDQQRGYQTLIDEKERYIKEWERYTRVLSIQQRFNRYNVAVDGLRQAITDEINGFGDEDLVVTRSTLHQRLAERLNTLPGRFYERLYMSARDLVCEVMFPHTMGLAILKTIDAIGEDQPSLNPREAALLATIELVSDWVVACCRITTFQTVKAA